MKERVRECFNKGAESYDSAAIVQAKVAKYLSKRIPKIIPHTILEIGCGTGLFSQEILAFFPKASILLIDIAPVMVETCKMRFKDFLNVETISMDGELLKDLDFSFDLIISSMSLHWFTEISASFNKIISKLSSGGQFVFAMLGNNSLPEWREICNQHNFPNPMPSLPQVQRLKQDFPHIEFEIETLTQSYNSIYDFLTTLKKIGAVATHENYAKSSSGALRQLVRRFDEEIIISYEIIYGVYKKL